MLKLIVPDMTCGHCTSAVTTAIKSVDADATVEIDLEKQQVTIESTAEAAALATAIEAAGYPSVSAQP
ncbi:heavy-metal-associated domain-containing protein [Litchfieldella rifensis]|uniref:Heavy-metal-associated domain-containing protein n=1 Tax=Litchfieldella rifensis TaxID=762643 RepID=A0ABV7LIN0_9GAMM